MASAPQARSPSCSAARARPRDRTSTGHRGTRRSAPLAGAVLLAVGMAASFGGAVGPSAQAATATSPSAARTWYVTAGGATSHQEFQGLGFYPGIITIDAGDTIVWQDGSMEPHTVTFLSGNPAPKDFMRPIGGHTYGGSGVVSSGMLLPGQRYRLTFTQPGVYIYQCLMHPGMVGAVIVQPAGTPYPKDQTAYDRIGKAELRADLDAMARIWSAAHPSVTPGPSSSRVYHVLAGLAPDPVTTLSLAPLGNSSARGTAVLRILPPGRLQVTVTVSGLAPGSVHMAHIHAGSCAQQGPVLYPLQPLRAGSDGVATATTVVPNVLGIAEAGWYVNVHAGATGANGGLRPIACGNVVFHNASAMRFDPPVVTVRAGDTVSWLQPAGNELHTVTLLAPGQKPPMNLAAQARPAGGHVVTGPGYYNSGLLYPGQTYRLTFAQPGTYAYRCLLHDEMGMLGKVIVLPRLLTASAPGRGRLRPARR